MKRLQACVGWLAFWLAVFVLLAVARDPVTVGLAWYGPMRSLGRMP